VCIEDKAKKFTWIVRYSKKDGERKGGKGGELPQPGMNAKKKKLNWGGRGTRGGEGKSEPLRRSRQEFKKRLMKTTSETLERGIKVKGTMMAKQRQELVCPRIGQKKRRVPKRGEATMLRRISNKELNESAGMSLGDCIIWERTIWLLRGK